MRTINEIDGRGELIGNRTIDKLRLRILPFLFLLYVVSFLDRINIGFAALTMNKELAITSQQFGLLVGIFFLGYSLFEIPSNLFLHKIGARIWMARILLTRGILATLTGFVHNVHQLYVVRFLLGLAEAGYFPGMVLYLTYWGESEYGSPITVRCMGSAGQLFWPRFLWNGGPILLPAVTRADISN
jgi:sugar phosphate permease